MYKLLMKVGRHNLFTRYFIIYLGGLALSVLLLSGRPTFDYQKTITADFIRVPIKQVFKELNEQVGLKFVYSPRDLDESRTVTLRFKNATVPYALDKIFSVLKASYTIKDNTIIVQRENKPVAQVQRTVKGTVVNETNEALPNATIRTDAGNLETRTDGVGNFEIKTIEQDTYLTVSLVGYVTQRVNLSESTAYRIILKDSVSTLDEVVVVGFGTQRRASVVGAITSIEPKRLQIGTSRSMSNNLAGQLAGIIAVQRSGEPGYDNSNFWIRGISTFGGNRSPLVLVDGVERSLDNMDPEEIESFSILKDAAASAVYGVRGANGVILINTKRGKVGKPNVSVRFEQGVTSPVQLPDFIDAASYLEVMNSIREERGVPGLYSQERIDNIRNGVDPDLYPNVNWLDAILRDR